MSNLSTPQTAPAAQPASAVTLDKFRWMVCALLFFATTINYIDRQILSLLKEILDKQFGWTNEQYGLINSAFQLAYGIGLIGSGWFVDRFGAKIGYAVSISAWSLAAVAHAFVGSFAGFRFVRIALGIGESGNFPSAIKAVALWFPIRERAFATSLFNAGTNMGALLAPAIVPLMAYKWGWQSPFIVAGIAGFIWLIFWLWLYNTPDKRNQQQSALAQQEQDSKEAGQEQTHAKQSWLRLLAYRQTWSFIIGKFLTDPVWWFFLVWLPDYFNKTRGLDIKHSWPHLVTIYGLITILSIGGGWITGFLTGRGWTVTRARKTGMFFFALCALPISLATHPQVGVWTVVLLIGLAGSAHQAWSANLFTTVSDMFPKQAVASVIGLGGMAGSLGAAIFQTQTGKLLDHFESLHNIKAGYAILFGICSVMYLLAFMLNHFLAPKYEQIESN